MGKERRREEGSHCRVPWAGLLAAGLLVSFFLALVVSEVLRSASSSDAYYAWKPRTRAVFHLPPGLAPGVGSESHFSINAEGIRGDRFAANQRYRILAIGGSTTECLWLDDSEAWPHVLQELLNARVDGYQTWVGNVGKSGLNTRHHRLHAKFLLPQYPRIDALILIAGVNDMLYRLAHDVDYRPQPPEAVESDIKQMKRAFDVLPRRYQDAPLYRRTNLWRGLAALKFRLFTWLGVEQRFQDEHGRFLDIWRRHRQAAGTFRDSLPDLATALEEYRHNLNAIVDEAGRFNARVVFVTQPVMWRPGLPPELRALLWLGGVGDYPVHSGWDYYSVEALARGMELYNRTLLEVCQARKVECIDLAAVLPRDTGVFYDDVHFNGPGARRVAEAIAEYLLTHGKLGEFLSPPHGGTPSLSRGQHGGSLPVPAVKRSIVSYLVHPVTSG